MSKIGLVGPSNAQRSLPFDAQRTVNMFPVLDQQGKEVSALYGTPGLSLFAGTGLLAVRGNFYSSNGRAFVIAGVTLYEISSLGVATSRGTLSTTYQANIVSFDENTVQLGMCDGNNVYTFTYATNTFAQVVDVDLPVSGTITSIDSYFVVNKVNTGQFNISAINDGTSWAALDFATAESSPDALSRVLNAVGQLWLFGTKTTEIWTNTGASAFPFERASGGKLEVGILAPHTAVATDGSVIWLGQDNYGSGIVYRAQGFTPQRISDDAVEYSIQQAPSPSTFRAYTYQQEGHAFYILTGGGLNTTWVYDLSTQLWHERAYLNANGFFEAHLGVCGMYAFGKQLVGDRSNGNIYQMSLDYYSDNGSAIARERTYTHLSDEGKRIRYNSLEIDYESGVGTQAGQGVNPMVQLRMSKDGGRTYGQFFTGTIGAVGAYRTKTRFRRLGISEITTFQIRVTDPVRVNICGSYLNVTGG